MYKRVGIGFTWNIDTINLDESENREKFFEANSTKSQYRIHYLKKMDILYTKFIATSYNKNKMKILENISYILSHYFQENGTLSSDLHITNKLPKVCLTLGRVIIS